MTSILAGFLGGIGFSELIIILVIVLLLFGSTKIPQIMRGMGQGIGEFKKGLKEGNTEDPPKAEPPAEKK
ncbi:MAG TPA: twin-arginine translocase TatA/TatE family subunit [Planctomycetota bacterium]|jgi:sec-independent protein translocase protein TatA|nr:twin-arginine translocase TatA/TatE family subunit [Planctomycetota bacterium]